MDKKFNLTEEPWIYVIDNHGHTREVSLKDIFAHAHEYVDLANETPTEDIAILRLLLAIMYTVFFRYDLDGNPSVPEDCEAALDRWEELYNANSFPEKTVQAYLDAHKEEFWLFHPEYPFYQWRELEDILSADKQKEGKNMHGETLESNNKKNLFNVRGGKFKDSMSYSEAVRSMISMLAYDDASVKESKANKAGKKASAKEDGKKLSPGSGWLGKCGAVYPIGNNLFDTLLLNFEMMYDVEEFRDEDEWEEWIEQRPIWERDESKYSKSRMEREFVSIPSNMAEFYTFPTRRMLLVERDGSVNKYYKTYGPFYSMNCRIEPMTLRIGTSDKRDFYEPRLHNTDQYLWQEFGMTFIGEENEDKPTTPGIVRWISYLKENDLIKRDEVIRFRSVFMEYKDKSQGIKNIGSDSLSMNSDLLADKGRYWMLQINNEIDRSKEFANKKLTWFAKQLDFASGITTNGNLENEITTQFYFRINMSFREWLLSIKRDADRRESAEKINEWRSICASVAMSLGREMVDRCGTSAYIGRYVVNQNEQKTENKFYCSSKALNYLGKEIKTYKEGA